jgi:MinD-like ATPase involved in chromosome partitioning or flagellar assembly
VDGTETGWSRPAEPAPRWRALLDRARLGGRSGEQPEPDDSWVDELRAAGSSTDLSAYRPPGGSQPGRSDLGQPADAGYRAEPGNAAGPGYGPDPGQSAESRYSVLSNGYQPEPAPPAESRYAALDTDYGRPAPDTDYGRADPSYGRADAGYGRVDRGYGRADPAAGYGQPDPPAGYGRADPAAGYGEADPAAGYGRADPAYGRADAGPGRPDPGYGQADPGYGQAVAGYARGDAGYGQTDPGFARADPGYGQADAVADYGRADPGYGRADPGYGRADPGYGRAGSGYGQADPGYPPVRSGTVGAAASVPITAPAPTTAPAPVPIIAPALAPAAVAAPTMVPAVATATARVAPARGGAAVPGNSNGYGLGQVEWRESSRDAEVDRAVNVLRRDLGTPRVLAFANPKGGVHKTTATVLAAATVGSVRGRGVLAWDDNELRGTLGLRAGSARHARTIRHLITDLDEVEPRHGADLTGRLDDYLRHASDGSYNVLAGEESPRFASRLDQHTVRRVLDLLRRTQDVICVDTGNNVESVNWQTVVQAADQLVVTTVPREDAAFSADWMLDLLHEVGMGELADNAVTLVSCPTPGRSPLQADLERHFATRTRAVVVVPYDPALESGSSIEYAQLQHETRQAWLKAASVMIEPFAR